MANPFAGEVRLRLNGKAHELKLTLGALAELEAELHGETVLDMIERFEAGKFSSRDVLSLIVAGLRGGGWDGTARELLTVDIEGGLMEATKVAAQLLARSFSVGDTL